MTDGTHGGDEPLDGDIGPARGPRDAHGAARGSGAPAESPTDPLDELRRYEAEREERRAHTNAWAGLFTRGLAALLLAFLAVDSITTALTARGRGDPWIYPPAVIGGVCAAGLIGLAVDAVRRIGARRRGGRVS